MTWRESKPGLILLCVGAFVPLAEAQDKEVLALEDRMREALGVTADEHGLERRSNFRMEDRLDIPTGRLRRYASAEYERRKGLANA